MLIRRSGEAGWRAPAVTAYEDEAAIQALLAQSPDLMPGGAGQRFAIAREVALDAGYVDLIGVTPDGEITLIECKLKANPEIRRHVVGQIVAYAATLWEMDYVALDAAFEARAGESLTKAVSKIAGDGWDEEAFRGALAANLAAGRFRLVIAVDDITEELRRIVRFLNGHTTPELEVLALELRYVADSGVEILFPTTYGERPVTTENQRAQVWGEERFFSTINPMLAPAGVLAARQLYDYALARGATMRWGASSYPSVSARMTIGGKPITVYSLSLWGPKVKPKLYILFEYLVGNVSDESLMRFARDLYEIPGLSDTLPNIQAAGFKKQPSIELDALSAEAVAAVEQALDRLDSNP